MSNVGFYDESGVYVSASELLAQVQALTLQNEAIQAEIEQLKLATEQAATNATIASDSAGQAQLAAEAARDAAVAANNAAQAALANQPDLYVDVVVVTGTSYTLTDADTNKLIYCSNASATTITVPDDLTLGFGCMFLGLNDTVTLTSSGTILNNNVYPSEALGSLLCLGAGVYVSTER